jgi:hypothetical protein
MRADSAASEQPHYGCNAGQRTRNRREALPVPNDPRREIRGAGSIYHFYFKQRSIMSSTFSMKGVTVATVLTVGLSGWAYAADNSSNAQRFAEQNAYWQALATPMSAGSPPVDRSVGPADPEPAVYSRAGEIARSRQMDAQLQAESTNMPASSPRVDKSEAAADPIAKATTIGQKEARFAAEEQFLEQNSTR